MNGYVLITVLWSDGDSVHHLRTGLARLVSLQLEGPLEDSVLDWCSGSSGWVFHCWIHCCKCCPGLLFVTTMIIYPKAKITKMWFLQACWRRLCFMQNIKVSLPKATQVCSICQCFLYFNDAEVNLCIHLITVFYFEFSCKYLPSV